MASPAPPVSSFGRVALSALPLSAVLSRDNVSQGSAAVFTAGSGYGKPTAVATLGKRRTVHRSAFATVAAGESAARSAAAPLAPSTVRAEERSESDNETAVADHSAKRIRSDSPSAADATSTDSHSTSVVRVGASGVHSASFSFMPPSTPAAHAALSNAATPLSHSHSHSHSLSTSSSASSLLCSEDLPAELLSSAVCPVHLLGGEWGAMCADYERLLDRCYVLSCLRLEHQHDSYHSRLYIRALEDRCAALQQRSSVADDSSGGGSGGSSAGWRCGGCGALCDGCLTDSGSGASSLRRLLSDRVQVGRLCSSHRRSWFELLERRVQQRDERMARMDSERAAEREQWRNKQRSLEHEVSRLRIELQLNNAAANAHSAVAR